VYDRGRLRMQDPLRGRGNGVNTPARGAGLQAGEKCRHVGGRKGLGVYRLQPFGIGGAQQATMTQPDRPEGSTWL
jgi:hypothetical protein